MSTDIKTPPLPESVNTATLGSWQVQSGTKVNRDDVLVVLETDKAAIEINAPKDGIMGEILKIEGDEVSDGEVLGVLLAAKETSQSDAQVLADKSIKAGPAARQLIEENALDGSLIKGTGKSGTITKADVLNYLSSRGGQEQEKIASNAQSATTSDINRVSEEPTAPPEDSSSVANVTAGNEKRVPMTRLRKIIATNMLRSAQNTAMLTTFNEVNMRNLQKIRKQHGTAFEKRHDVRLGLMSFFVHACVNALQQYPEVNAAIDGDEVVYHTTQDIGVAVATERGLVVPVLHNAQQMDLAQIEMSILKLGKKAADNTLTMEDIKGGTFTVTNGGVFGSLLSTPFLNPPQSGILGMHKITERPVAINGEVCIEPMMYVALSYDHRLIDGREAVLFLSHVKNQIEDPLSMLLKL